MTRAEGIAALKRVLALLPEDPELWSLASILMDTPGCILQRAAGEECPAVVGGRTAEGYVLSAVLGLTDREAAHIAGAYDARQKPVLEELIAALV